jgi:hypothetical protein
MVKGEASAQKEEAAQHRVEMQNGLDALFDIIYRCLRGYPWPASVSLLRRRRTTATRPPHPQTAVVVNAISNNGGSKTFHCHTKDMTAVLVFF